MQAVGLLEDDDIQFMKYEKYYPNGEIKWLVQDYTVRSNHLLTPQQFKSVRKIIIPETISLIQSKLPSS